MTSETVEGARAPEGENSWLVSSWSRRARTISRFSIIVPQRIEWEERRVRSSFTDSEDSEVSVAERSNGAAVVLDWEEVRVSNVSCGAQVSGACGMDVGLDIWRRPFVVEC